MSPKAVTKKPTRSKTPTAPLVKSRTVVKAHKTYSAKPADVVRKWYVIDASETTLGRVATKAASLLTGKGKPQFTSHIDCGDYVVVVNAKDLKVTGTKLTDKKYYRHSGHAGNLRSRTLQEQLDLDPTKVIEVAISGMLPVNKLRPARLERLKVYSGADHKHEAQQPQTLTLKGAA